MILHKNQQCNRCVMDQTDPEITFNDAGICNLCEEFIVKRSKHNYQGETSDLALKNIIEKIKKDGKGNEYDCIVGLSGGVDSSYTAYLLKQNGLRILGVHLDNGWNSEEAVANIENIAKN